ncbi:FG-GAP repeat domain-containing protein [Tautonia sociabilis]|uniref:VCBS repeat-containing protein n=1 Tax=Tautonia sociabilis TaxID=2080755 RepID=A0A432MKZ9_9BACT|nr:VCBS repeat-containing protein [Tautonia sociabilis]RUL88104.1 VCBS repeat-containing protein [Tautonia sociabilis]
MLRLLETIILCASWPAIAGDDSPPRPPGPEGWPRHTIDASSRGADGVRLADLDGDGDLDIATGWEEGGVIRVALNPLRDGDPVRSPWPAVTVGSVPSPEDAVIVDLDADGFPDVVSCAEGRTRTVSVHWNPANPDAMLDPDSWQTRAIPATVGLQMWMWCVPLQVDGRNGIDLVLGGKGEGAAIGWLEAPEDPRDLSSWRWHSIRPAGWVMSILPIDLDGDGDQDLVCSDRKGPRRGVFWLERRPGRDEPRWVERPIGGSSHEMMFLDCVASDGDGPLELLGASLDAGVVRFRKAADGWEETVIPLGPGVGTGKSVAGGDLDRDGRIELVVSTENASGKQGVVLLDREADGPEVPWLVFPLSGTERGAKYDLVRLLDLDGDGDLDVLTCEERDNLGVIWYENPAR